MTHICSGALNQWLLVPTDELLCSGLIAERITYFSV